MRSVCVEWVSDLYLGNAKREPVGGNCDLPILWSLRVGERSQQGVSLGEIGGGRKDSNSYQDGTS